MDSEFPPPKPEEHESQLWMLPPAEGLHFKNIDGVRAGGYLEYKNAERWALTHGR